MKHTTALALAIALSGCAVHRESASAVDAHEALRAAIHRVEEPSRVTTTVEEYAPPDGPLAAPGTGSSGSPVGRGVASVSPPTLVTLPLHGPLIKLTTTVEEKGAIRTDTSAVASASVDAKSETESSSKPSLGISLWFLLIPAALAALAYLLRKRIPFLAWIP